MLTLGQYEIFSVIDFGDSNYNPLLYELAISIMYMMTKCTEIEPSMAGELSILIG